MNYPATTTTAAKVDLHSLHSTGLFSYSSADNTEDTTASSTSNAVSSVWQQCHQLQQPRAALRRDTEDTGVFLLLLSSYKVVLTDFSLNSWSSGRPARCCCPCCPFYVLWSFIITPSFSHSLKLNCASPLLPNSLYSALTLSSADHQYYY